MLTYLESLGSNKAFLVAQVLKNLLAMQETGVQSAKLGRSSGGGGGEERRRGA